MWIWSLARKLPYAVGEEAPLPKEMHMYNWVSLLYNRNWHNVVNLLYSIKIKKIKQERINCLTHSGPFLLHWHKALHTLGESMRFSFVLIVVQLVHIRGFLKALAIVPFQLCYWCSSCIWIILNNCSIGTSVSRNIDTFYSFFKVEV